MTEVRSGKIVATSLEEYQAMVAPWAIQLEQMDRGALHASVEFFATQHLLVTREWRTHTVQVAGQTPGEHYVFAAPVENTVPIVSRGELLGTGRLGTAAAASEVDAVLPGGGAHWEVFIPFSQVEGIALDWGVSPDLLDGLLDVDVQASMLDTLTSIVVGALDRVAATPHMLDDPLTSESIERSILSALFSCLHTETKGSDPLRGRPWSRRRALRRAIDVVQTSNRRVPIPSLARIAGVSQRTLQYAFLESVGVTPTQYILRHRLNRVRQDLVRSSAGDATVSRVASRHGITELGRFAVRYRRLFGESPSETLGGGSSTMVRSLQDAIPAPRESVAV